MPELPEVEVLVRHLRPLLAGRLIHRVEVRRARVIRPNTPAQLTRALTGLQFAALKRRGKFMLFHLVPPLRHRPAPSDGPGDGPSAGDLRLLGHLGMSGRMYLLPAAEPLPKHAAVVLNLGPDNFVFEDTRYFGRLTLDTTPVDRLGPEPLARRFDFPHFARALGRSSQPVKVKLLDQSVLAGVGNIYASEALFRAGISPRRPARSLRPPEIARLATSIRSVLQRAIRFGSTVPLSFRAGPNGDRLFYYGSRSDRAAGRSPGEERLLVYGRAGRPCARCRRPIRQLVQAGRSTFFCHHCQPRSPSRPRVER